MAFFFKKQRYEYIVWRTEGENTAYIQENYWFCGLKKTATEKAHTLKLNLTEEVEIYDSSRFSFCLFVYISQHSLGKVKVSHSPWQQSCQQDGLHRHSSPDLRELRMIVVGLSQTGPLCPRIDLVDTPFLHHPRKRLKKY